MGIRRLPLMIATAKQILKKQSFNGNLPKGLVAVHVGESQRKRFVVPISYLNHPYFQDLLSQAEEEFEFNQPMGALTFPCNEDAFINLTSTIFAS